MKKCVLGDVADVKVSGVDKKTNEGEISVRLCNYTDVYYNWAVTSEKYDGLMRASAKPDEISKFKIKKGQVALTKDSETRDDIGIPTYIADDFDDVLLGYHCALISPDAKELSGKYLNALLRTKYVKDFFANNAGGSGQRYYLSESSIKELPLFLPDITVQRKIGTFLSTIDRKIALNRKRIATLEAMAKEIYDYWFVQFDFPDANGRPYKSSGGAMVYNPDLKREIPKGWEVKRIGDVLSKIPSTEKVPTVNYSDIGIIPIIDQSEKFIAGYTDNDAAALDLKSCVVFGDHSCTVKYVNFRFARGADGTQILHSNTPLIDDTQLYFTLLGMDFDEGYKRHFSALKDKLLVISSDASLTKKYMSVVDVIFAQIRALRQMSNMLVAFRDFLLPVLMNGQVKVG